MSNISNTRVTQGNFSKWLGQRRTARDKRIEKIKTLYGYGHDWDTRDFVEATLGNEFTDKDLQEAYQPF